MYGRFVCKWTACVPGTRGGQGRALDSLELESKTVVSCVLGTEARPSVGVVRVLNHWSISPSPHPRHLMDQYSLMTPQKQRLFHKWRREMSPKKRLNCERNSTCRCWVWRWRKWFCEGRKEAASRNCGGDKLTVSRDRIFQPGPAHTLALSQHDPCLT